MVVKISSKIIQQEFIEYICPSFSFGNQLINELELKKHLEKNYMLVFNTNDIRIII
jgi:hypothetical protein